VISHGIELNSEVIREFCRKWKIKELCVFGSFLRDDFGPDSDIDFLLEHDDDAEWDLFDSLRMQDELAEIVGRPVDLVDRHAMEHGGNRFVTKQILDSAEPVYGK